MVIFCFDLTLAVLAHRHGRGPDFLIHDSHLYDGVDERQIAKSPHPPVAAQVTAEEGLQYIVTINTDSLGVAAQRGFDPEPYIRSPRLTDEHEAGDLVGFRFKTSTARISTERALCGQCQEEGKDCPESFQEMTRRMTMIVNGTATSKAHAMAPGKFFLRRR